MIVTKSSKLFTFPSSFLNDLIQIESVVYIFFLSFENGVIKIESVVYILTPFKSSDANRVYC